MRALIGLSALLLLGGCNAVVRQDSNSFEASGDVGRYEMDAQVCGMAAANYVSYDVRGMSGTSYDRNRAYNAVFARCMTGRGYAARDYPENWLD